MLLILILRMIGELIVQGLFFKVGVIYLSDELVQSHKKICEKG
jgi:hypothetical protein